MFRGLLGFLFKEALPRGITILFGSSFLISVFVGLVMALCGEGLVLKPTSVSVLSGYLLTYSAIAAGFCLTGFTLVLTLPNETFAKKLSDNYARKNKRDSYSNLLFVFSWAGLIHWFLIVSAIILLVFTDDKSEFFSSGSNAMSRGVTGYITGLTVYCILLFLTIVVTLYQAGAVYIGFLKKKIMEEKGTSGVPQK